MDLTGSRPTGVARPDIRVGVVLVNWNTPDFTIPCIKSLQAGTCRPRTILVFDNASSDGSCDDIAARFPDVVLVRSPTNLGFTGANNAGIRRLLADGADYVWVLNNDTVVEPSCLERLVRVAESNPGIAALGAKILYADPPNAVWYGGARLNPFSFTAGHAGVGRPATFGPREPTPVDFITGCSMLISRRALASVGLFDDRLFAYSEDFDWSLRARRQGLPLVYVPQAVVYHKVSASLSRNTLGTSGGTASPRVYYLATRNFFWVVRKHATWWQVVTATATRMVLVGYLSAGMTILRRWEKLSALWRGVRDGLLGRIPEPV
jgi:hypothetical protein